MDAERWQRIEEILDEVLDLPPEEIPAHLDTACAEDPELRAEIENLLAAEQRADGIFEGSAAEVVSTLFAEAGKTAFDEHSNTMVGRQLGPYRLLHLLGAGGMGEVWKAHDTRLERSVALKLLPQEWSRNEEAKERFLREARTASALDHPNILNVHDLGEAEDGQLYLVTSYYPGETLKQKLDRGPLSFGQVRKVAVEVARGLERAHEAGIVHRDIKPSNVMVTDRGEVKILDFGIARIADDAALTQSGTLPGTPAYMSPEQVAGKPLDARSDLWSLGVVLHELITGQRPFRGDQALVVMRSIVDDAPAPLERQGEDIPEDLQGLVTRALAKDPADRFQNAAEFLGELHLPGPTQTVLLPPNPRRPLPTAALLLALILLAFGGWWAWRTTTSAPNPGGQQLPAQASTLERSTPPPNLVDARATLAVLYFENLAGVPTLEWLRSGITDMLVTDLSQSPEIQVLSSSRLYQILQNLDALDQPAPSFEVTQGVAEQSGANAVVRGSFLRLGEVLRITFTLEDPNDGTIQASQRFEGEGEESLFSLVDQLSATIRKHYEVVAPGGVQAAVQDITTTSLDAWRLYSEAVALQHQSRETEALPLLEQAIAQDPEFALALVTLGGIHANLGNAGLASSYKRRAVEQADHLPLDQRFSISATHYATQWSTYGRAIDSYQEALQLDPEKTARRNNLGILYSVLERYDEANHEFELLLDKDDFAPGYLSTANTYAAQGRLEEGHRLLSNFAAENTENWYGQLALGWYLIQENKLETVETHLSNAETLRPGTRHVDYVRWRLHVMRLNFDAAERSAQTMLGYDAPAQRWRGTVSSALNSLYRGHSREAIEAFTIASAAFPEPEAYTALAHAWRADLLLELGEAERALLAARQARKEAPGTWPDYLGIFYESLASQQLGKSGQANALHIDLKARWKQQPNTVEERQLKHLEGRLALARGDVETAVEALRKAEELLPPRGIEIHDYALPDHLPIWFALGEAERAAGRQDAAWTWFSKVVESGSERIMFPLPWVRSFYFLGEIHLARGETEDARHHFERFLALWEEGDMDRDRIAEAARQARR